jgi:F420-dependent oxidoreductase-like protein
MDAVTPLAYLAARTHRITLGSGIMQISARVPTMTAMTAMTLAKISGDRFALGLGASGPQVVEGMHGQPFSRPITRMRETIEIIRLAFSGEKIAYEGRHHVLPRPGGQGKALRIAQPANPGIPIYLAALSPRGLELTGELADGWLGTSFTPEHAEAHLAHLRTGAERAGRSLADLDLAAGGQVAITDDPEPLFDALRPRLAFTLGAMGSATTNFYNDAFRRGGFDDVAREVQALWLAGRRTDAAAAVPGSLLEQTTLIGDEAHVRARIRRYRDAGITTLRIEPLGGEPAARLETLGRAVDLVRSVAAED